jgi:hypothetical protein
MSLLISGLGFDSLAAHDLQVRDMHDLQAHHSQERLMAMIEDTELRLIVFEAASLVPLVRAVVQRCTTDPDPGQELARACHTVTQGYLELRKRIWAMPETPENHHVERLLNYQQHILEQAGLLAFRPRLGGHDSWAALAQRFGHHADGPGDELIRLAGLADLA